MVLGQPGLYLDPPITRQTNKCTSAIGSIQIQNPPCHPSHIRDQRFHAGPSSRLPSRLPSRSSRTATPPRAAPHRAPDHQRRRRSRITHAVALARSATRTPPRSGSTPASTSPPSLHRRNPATRTTGVGPPQVHLARRRTGAHRADQRRPGPRRGRRQGPGRHLHRRPLLPCIGVIRRRGRPALDLHRYT
jgi:hypothetical protein